MASEGASGADRSDKSSENQSNDRADKAERAENDLSDSARDALSGGEKSRSDEAASARDREASQEKMAAENQPAKDRLDRETKGHTDFESTPDVDPAVDPDSVDRAAGELGASDGPVDAPAAEAEGAETETGETQAGETAAGETVSEAEAAREMRAEAEATARDIVEANTTNTGALNIQTGEDIVHVHSEGIAQDLVDLARSTPPEMMEAVFKGVLDAVPHPEDVATEVNQLVAEKAGATQALTGGAALDPADPAEVGAAVDALLEAETGTDGRVDMQDVAFAVEQVGVEDPAMAEAMRRELAEALPPAEAADLNRMISGGWRRLEQMEVAIENPLMGGWGAAKQGANIVTGTAELVANVANRVDTLYHSSVGSLYDAVALEGWADRQFELAEHYEQVRLDRDWTFDMNNTAEAGGAAITTTVEIAAAGYGLSRMGARYLDDAAAVASARTFVPGGGWTPTNESMSAAARLSGCLARCSVGRELHSR